MKYLALLALLIAIPVQAQTLDGGTGICTASQCSDFISKRNHMQFAIMNNLNCNGHGHTMESSPLCPMSDGRIVTGTLIVAGNPESWTFEADRISNTQWQLKVKLPGSEQLIVYWLPVCVETTQYPAVAYASITFALAAGGASYKVGYMGDPTPTPTFCYAILIEGSN